MQGKVRNDRILKGLPRRTLYFSQQPKGVLCDTPRAYCTLKESENLARISNAL